MFEISISLIGDRLQGLKALEKRRQLGLPDDVHLMAVSRTSGYCITPSCEVSETFARTWFGPEDTQASTVIDYNDVSPSDVQVVNSQMLQGPITFIHGMAPERVQELFVMAKIKGLRSQISQMEEE